MKYNASELDIIFLSYDEPNAEENWTDLLNKVPWAKRVHGVTGFDNAHKECANQSETEYFITVDGDTVIMPQFMELELDYDRDPEFPHSVLSWNAKNMTNGMVYGNGGLKIWPRDVALSMKTHENSEEEENSIEFCWGINYIQMNNIYSMTFINATPYQAFRAGFREGVKMSLQEGKRVEPNKFKDSIWYENFKRLCIWTSVGTDVPNGEWSIYGARLGCYLTALDSTFDRTLVRDYQWFNQFWEEHEGDDPFNDSKKLGNVLRNELSLQCADLDPRQSAFVKEIFTDPRQLDPLLKESDVFSRLYR